MHHARVTPGLLILMSGLCGCAHTGPIQMVSPEPLKTTASVGDRALPVVAGQPGSSLRADTADSALPRTARGRISGRVYDEEGHPVPNARVRLAVGAAPAGKAVYSNTDRSGAFTLGGLRPGSNYTVIAEYQGEQGMMSGRADADAPDTNLRIGLHLRDIGIGEERNDVRTASRPERPNVKAISQVEPIDDSDYYDDEEPPRAAAAVKRKVIARPADDDAAELSRAEPRRGWSSSGGSSRPPRAEPPAAPFLEDEGDFDQENPLPPAIELNVDPIDDRPERTPVNSGATRSRRRTPSPVIEPEPEPEVESDADAEAEFDAPRALPDGFANGGRSSRSQAYAPLSLDGPDAEPAPAHSPAPARSPRRRPRANDFPEVPDEVPQVFQPPRRPTWSELADQSASIPLDEGVVKTSARSLAPRIAPIETSASQPIARGIGGGSLAPSLLTDRKTSQFCDFDASEQRLINFALPDVDGRLVAISDLNADLILLDFWGTWCDKCITSIPHLTELQAKLGGKRLQVVGIACEQTAAPARSAKVSAVVKKLGINYTVVVSTMDGACPVQDAFQIRYYPTMILLDRNGRILCRVEGATAETLGRLDRYIAKNLDREPSSRTVAIGDRSARKR